MKVSRKLLYGLIVFSAAFLLRLAYLSMFVSSDFHACPILDELDYLDLARNLIAHGMNPGAIIWRPPLYPLFLAIVMRSADSVSFTLPAVQIFLASLSAVLVFLIALRIFDLRIALLAGFLQAADWDSIMFPTHFLPVTLFTFLFLLTIHFLQQPAGPRRLFLAGVSAGLAALTRPTLLPAILVAALWLVRPLKMSGIRLRLAAYFLGGALLTITPWTTYNAVRFHAFIPVSPLGGYNLYAGNNPSADGKTVWASADELRRRNIPVSLNPALYQKAYARAVGEFIVDQPSTAFRLLLRKVYYLFNTYRISSNFDIPFLVNETVGPLRPVALPTLNIMLLLAALGLPSALRRRRVSAPLLIFSASLAAVLPIFFINERFRTPLLPCLVILAAAGLFRLPESWRSKRHLTLALAVLLAGISSSKLFDVDDPRDLVELDLRHGYAFLLRGRIASARKALARVLAVSPEHPHAQDLAARLEEKSSPPLKPTSPALGRQITPHEDK